MIRVHVTEFRTQNYGNFSQKSKQVKVLEMLFMYAAEYNINYHLKHYIIDGPHKTWKVHKQQHVHIYKQCSSDIKREFNPFVALRDRNGCCCKIKKHTHTHQKLIWIQQRWLTQVTQTRRCLFSGCSVLSTDLTLLTEPNPRFWTFSLWSISPKFSVWKADLKKKKKTSGDKSCTDKVRFYLQERWSRPVAPKHQSSEAPYFLS